MLECLRGRHLAALLLLLGSAQGLAQSLQVQESDSKPFLVEADATVYLSGAVTGFDPLLNLLHVSDAVVEIGRIQGSYADLAVGDLVVVLGIRSDLSNVVQAVAIEIVTPARRYVDGEPLPDEPAVPPQSIGTSEQLIELGKSKQSISGTGVQSISGTGITRDSISGTGVQSISGTGISSSSISGTGLQSISGTGITSSSISGTGVQSISGTGITSNSISGTGRQAVSGTNARRDSISGTGR